MKTILHPLWYDTNDKCVRILVLPVKSDNYCYIIFAGNDAVLVDPDNSPILFDTIEKTKMTINAVLITHEHHDHIGGLKEIVKRWDAGVYAAKNIRLPVAFKGVEDSECVHAGEISFKAIITPGHYDEFYPLESVNRNVVWYCEHAGSVFTGDTLFSCGYGYTTDKNVSTMIHSLKRLRELPDETQVFSGHEYTLLNTTFAQQLEPGSDELNDRLNKVRALLSDHIPTVPTSMGFEKRNNPFLRWDDPALQNILEFTGTTDIEAFMLLRARKKKFNASWR
jgi:hydroxyacylglutathione hydrolase